MRKNNELADFFNDNKKKLFGYLFKMTGNYDDAEDIFQDTFIKYAGKYPDKQSPALLFTVARSIFLDSIRKKRESGKDDTDDIEGGDNPEDVIINRSQQKKLLELMQKLTKEEREILSMAGPDGLSYDEIAKIKNMTRANVKVRIHRARVRLKEMMEKENG